MRASTSISFVRPSQPGTAGSASWSGALLPRRHIAWAQRGMKRSPVARLSPLSAATFRSDSLYPRIEQTVAVILKQEKVVAPVDVLVGMGLLAPDQLENWRRGRVPYLEQVIDCNLIRLSRLL